MGTEPELNGMAMEVTDDRRVAQVSAGPHRVKNREAIERDAAAMHPRVEIKGRVGSVRVRDGGFPYGPSPCVEASGEPAKRVLTGDDEAAKWHWLGLSYIWPGVIMVDSKQHYCNFVWGVRTTSAGLV